MIIDIKAGLMTNEIGKCQLIARMIDLGVLSIFLAPLGMQGPYSSKWGLNELTFLVR